MGTPAKKSVSLVILQILYCLFLLSSVRGAYFSFAGVVSAYSGVSSIIQIVIYVPLLYLLFKRGKIAYNAVVGFEIVRLLYTIIATVAFFPGWFAYDYFSITVGILTVVVQITVRPLILWLLIRKSRNVLVQEIL